MYSSVCIKCISSQYEVVSGYCMLCNTTCNCDGWAKTSVLGVCSTICGDCLIRGAEKCDDGNTKAHDGCSSTCQI